jgi:hypothetical protein
VCGMGTGGSPQLSPPDCAKSYWAALRRSAGRLDLTIPLVDYVMSYRLVSRREIRRLEMTTSAGRDCVHWTFRVCTLTTTQESEGTSIYQSQGLGRFVSVSYIRYRTSTPDRSTLSSTGGLTHLRDERSHLRAGFTLRCFQRFSVPNVATQLYPWRDNWYTIGSSTPVLSY